MNINNIIISIKNELDKIIDKVNENMIITILLIILLTFYISYYINNIELKYLEIFDNVIFKFIFIILISYLSTKNMAISITLTIALLVTLQIISNLKLKKELENDELN